MEWKSTFVLFLFCSLTIFSWLILVEAHPADNNDLRSPNDDPLAFSSNELPSEAAKSENKNPLTRNKRTIGFLRQIFPGISQIIDRKIQQITRILFRVVGRLILRGGGDGNNGGSSDGNGGDRKISITLPTYPPTEDEEEDTQSPTEKDAASTDTPDTDAKSSNGNSTDSSSTIGSSGDSGTAVTTPIETPESNMIVRKSRDVSDVLSDTTYSPLDEEISSSTTESTTRRGGLLSWGLGRGKRGGSLLGGNGSNGSGNFVFDLIRLIAGSGTTPEKDEELNAPREERDDDSVDNAEANDVNGGSNTGYNPEEDTSGIPGPLTRMALLVNRGISNVLKDIILRLAQTSERIVNFKARLLTAII